MPLAGLTIVPDNFDIGTDTSVIILIQRDSSPIPTNRKPRSKYVIGTYHKSENYTKIYVHSWPPSSLSIALLRKPPARPIDGSPALLHGELRQINTLEGGSIGAQMTP